MRMIIMFIIIQYVLGVGAGKHNIEPVRYQLFSAQ